MAQKTHPLIINVGFIIHEEVGYVRDFEFEDQELRLAPDLDLVHAAGTVSITRTPQGLLTDGHFSGLHSGKCARCLDDVEVPLKAEFVELYAFDNRSMTESGLVVPENAMIDLGPLVREYFLLALPINPLCKRDCLGLCPTCGKNLNKSHHTHKEEKIDPRFEVLKDLLEKKGK